MSRKPVIAVAFYSTWGHIGAMAEEVIKGVEATGATVKPYCFKETLPAEVLTKMHAGGSLDPKYPVLTPNDLLEADGLIIGTGTRYGRVPAQVSAFFDQCGQLWATGALVGKFVTMFTSAAGQHGGHETTAFTTMPFFVHQGMVYVPIGYQFPELNELDQVQGNAPWGASTLSAGDGHLMPHANDLKVAYEQGKYFAGFVGTFVKGKHSATTTATSAPLAKALPGAIATPAKKEEGYAVAPTTKTESTAPTAATGATSPTTPHTTGPTSAQPTQTATPKRKSWFASCCGGDGIDN